jgi:hypothetical protein
MITPSPEGQANRYLYFGAFIGQISAMINLYYAVFVVYPMYQHAYSSSIGMFLKGYSLITVILASWVIIKFLHYRKLALEEKMKWYMLTHWFRWLGCTIPAVFTVIFLHIEFLYVFLAILLMTDIPFLFLIAKNNGLTSELMRSKTYVYLLTLSSFAAYSLMPYVLLNFLAAFTSFIVLLLC